MFKGLPEPVIMLRFRIFAIIKCGHHLGKHINVNFITFKKLNKYLLIANRCYIIKHLISKYNFTKGLIMSCDKRKRKIFKKNTIFVFFFICTYSVLEARLVSSCLSWPSSASPHLSLLLASSGVTVNTLLSVNPGPTGQPSLDTTHTVTVHIGLI